MLEVLHKALYLVWQNDDTEALKVVALLLAKLPMYFSMDYDFHEMFGNINPLELKKGDVIKTTKDVKMKNLTLKTDNEEIIPMFTTSEQAHKGPSVNISRCIRRTIYLY